MGAKGAPASGAPAPWWPPWEPRSGGAWCAERGLDSRPVWASVLPVCSDRAPGSAFPMRKCSRLLVPVTWVPLNTARGQTNGHSSQSTRAMCSSGD